MAEEKKEEKKEDAASRADAEKLDMILRGVTDACEKMDRVDKRMDAFEAKHGRKDADTEAKEEKKEKEEEGHVEPKDKKDSKRKDARKDADPPDDADKMKGDDDDSKRKDSKKADDDDEDGEEMGEKEKPKEMIADKKKKGRKDDDDSKKDDDDDSKRDDSSILDLKKNFADLQKKYVELAGRTPRAMSDAEWGEMSRYQARADEVMVKLGERAPRPLVGEAPMAYRRRVAEMLRKHSPTWKDIPQVLSIADEAFDKIENQIYADADVASRSPQGLPEGAIVPYETRGPGGHIVVEFRGGPKSHFVKQFERTLQKGVIIDPRLQRGH